MKKHLLGILCAVAAAAATSGCIGFDRTSTQTGPTATGLNFLMGNWTSAGTAVSAASQCTNFKWNVTEQTGTSAKGTFSAICAGNLNVSGTAQGTLSGSTITWSGDGTASGAEITSCPITLTGTAELGADSIRIPYSGTTCLGPVSGVEILKKS